jgi:putative ATPase
MRSMGYGQGYRYAHDFPGHVVEQQHLPDQLAGRRFYEPSEQGCERGQSGALQKPERPPEDRR